MQPEVPTRSPGSPIRGDSDMNVCAKGDHSPGSMLATSNSTTTVQGPARPSVYNKSTVNTIGGDQHNTYITYMTSQADVQWLHGVLKPVDRSRYNIPQCMPGTRHNILERVDRWLGDVNEPNILWIRGSPGSGKSTIASSLASKLTESGRLGAFYAFKRGDITLGDPTTVWRTIAYDLARYWPFYENLLQALKSATFNPGRPDLALDFKYLIKEPLIASFSGATPIIIVDAVDECTSEGSQASQRKTFFDSLVDWSSLPTRCKLIVTGRNDRIPNMFRGVCKEMTLFTGSEVDEVANADIRVFFETRIAEFGECLDSGMLQRERVIERLITRAAGLFIWADTIVKFIEDGVHQSRLERVLNGSMGGGDNITKLYQQILKVSFPKPDDDTLKVFHHVLGAIILAKQPLHKDDLPHFTSENITSIEFILSKLSAVLSIGTDKRVRISHLSFNEFLCDPNQCPKSFYIDRDAENQKFTMACFGLMRKGLRFNICHLETSHVLNDEVKDLSKRIESNIGSALLYSCRFWTPHLEDTMVNGCDRDTLRQEVEYFLYSRLLFWLEVMSLTSEIPAAHASLSKIAPMIEALSTTLSDFVKDASQFIINFYQPISGSAPHIYISALPFSPAQSLVAKHYKPDFPKTVWALSGVHELWPACTNILQGHSGGVYAVTFSPDGARLASGSGDRMIRIWDIQTGQTIANPFKGHTKTIVSVTFSPDGARIASGSWDGAIRIWDVQTRQTIACVLENPLHSVCSVSFSPDGARVASGSSNTIRIWDAQTLLAVAGPFEGHTKSVCSVTFSPDGAHVASGSDDHTIRIWDVQTGQTIAGPFQGHSRSVHSVAFSPDGSQLASGSTDGTVRIWDTRTGQTIADPFEGHTRSVYSVKFSPDGARVVSGSQDNTIRIWDVKTGQTIAGPFEGHAHAVLSVAFSPDGTQVASGSVDDTIWIWDVQTGQAITDPLEGAVDPVLCVAFSPDGARVASGSWGSTTRIWDVRHGQAMKISLEGHSHSVYSVAFSPDGGRVVSGSRDGTIRIWDAQTGQIVRGPFEGHTDLVCSVSFFADGARVASGSWDNTIRIWDVENGQVIAGPFEGHSHSVYSVAFSPDEARVASGSWDGMIRIWDVKTGQNIACFSENHSIPVYSISFSPDGARVVSGSSDYTIRIWDAQTGQVIAGPFEGHSHSVYSVAFSPDGARVASGSEDKTIRIWDVQTGQTIAGPFEGHVDLVHSVAFSSDGAQVVSGSWDSTIRVWDVQTGLPVTETLAFNGSAADTKNYVPPSSSHPLHDGAGTLHSICYSQMNITESGWLRSKPNSSTASPCLVIWVPRLNRAGICTMETICIFGKRQTRLDLSRFVHGNDWAQCYAPINDAHSSSLSAPDRQVICPALDTPTDDLTMSNHLQHTHLPNTPPSAIKPVEFAAAEATASRTSHLVFFTSFVVALVAFVCLFFPILAGAE